MNVYRVKISADIVLALAPEVQPYWKSPGDYEANEIAHMITESGSDFEIETFEQITDPKQAPIPYQDPKCLIWHVGCGQQDINLKKALELQENYQIQEENARQARSKAYDQLQSLLDSLDGIPTHEKEFIKSNLDELQKEFS